MGNIILSNILKDGVVGDYQINESDRLLHTAIIGKTGVGGSKLMREMIIQDIKNNNSVILFTSNLDNINDLKNIISEDKKVIVLDTLEKDIKLDYDFNDKIVLIRMPEGGKSFEFIEMYFFTQIQKYMNQKFEKQEFKEPFYIYIHDFYKYRVRTTETLLAEARKYGIGLIVNSPFPLTNGQYSNISHIFVGSDTFNVFKDGDSLNENQIENIKKLNPFQWYLLKGE